MASKRRNMFQKNKTQETTENVADQALRLVKQRIQAGTDTSAIDYEIRFLERLVKETVQMELPDKLRGHVRTLDENASFGVVLARIDEEEDSHQASKEDRNSGWKTAKPKPSGSPTGGWEDTATSSASAATISPEEDKRRDQRGQAYRPSQDPMEVNAVQTPEGTWVFQPRRQTPSYPSAASSRSSGSDGSSDDEWPSLPSARGKQPRQPAGKPAISVAALSSTVLGGRGKTTAGPPIGK
ncbi:hypothetical protein AAG570_009078 [Ranatra chinensis]|uniref:Uncharacterized protein n=1 Tax=Ranatra chinensis TaxID=642074 RepID=A0ABD0Z3D7_9HEMI